MSASLEGWLGWLRRPAAKTEDETAATSGTSVPITGGGSDNEPVVVWEAANALEAQVVKGRLESEGIPAIVRGEALGVIYGLTTGGLAVTDVLVPSALAEKAMEILGVEPGAQDEEGEQPPEAGDMTGKE